MHELRLRRHKTAHQSLRKYKLKQKKHCKKHKRLPLRKFHHQTRRWENDTPPVFNDYSDDDDYFEFNDDDEMIDGAGEFNDDDEMVDGMDTVEQLELGLDDLSDNDSVDWGNDAPGNDLAEEDIMDFLDEVDFDGAGVEGADAAAKETIQLNTAFTFSPAEVSDALYATKYFDYLLYTKGIAGRQARSNMTRITTIIQFIMQRDPDVTHYRTLADVTAAIILSGYKWLQLFCQWLSLNKHRQPSTVGMYLRPFQNYLKWFSTLSLDNLPSNYGGQVNRNHTLVVDDAIDDIRSSYNRQVLNINSS